MHDLLIEAKNNYKLGKYEEAVKVLDKGIVNCILYPEVLVQKAACLQLTDNDNINLKDIENLYNQALSIDDNYYNTFIELANFQYSVLDKTQQAKDCFEKALIILRGALTETIVGIAKCVEEIEDEKMAIQYLKNVNSKLLDNNKINGLINEFEQIHD